MTVFWILNVIGWILDYTILLDDGGATPRGWQENRSLWYWFPATRERFKWKKIVLGHDLLASYNSEQAAAGVFGFIHQVSWANFFGHEN